MPPEWKCFAKTTSYFAVLSFILTGSFKISFFTSFQFYCLIQIKY